MNTQRRSAPVGAALAVALIGVVAAALLLNAMGTDLGLAGKRIRPELLNPDLGPLAGGKPMSLQEAVRAFDRPIYRPEAAGASDAEISGVWVRTTDEPEVYLQYSSGASVTIVANDRPISNADYYDQLIKEGIPGSFTNVDGVEAFVVPQDDQGNLGSIEFVLGDAIVTIIGHGDFSDDALISLAQSVIANADVVVAE